MTKEEFRRLTASQSPIFLDGATGTRMLANGMPRGCCTEQWIRDHKDVIQQLQREYIDAGSNIIYAPTFGANRISLSRHNLQKETRELNKTLLDYSLEIADGKAHVAGNVTTTGRILGYEDGYSYQHAYDNYCEQIMVQAESGAEMIVAETMIQFEETCAAVNACKSVCDLPILVTMTVRSNGGVYYGGNIREFGPMLENMGVSAIGVNCSAGPRQLAEVIKTLRPRVNIPIIAKPNAGIPRINENGEAVYAIRPEEFTGHMMTLYKNGATLLGGCCGTSPEFIRCLKEKFDDRKRYKYVDC